MRLVPVKHQVLAARLALKKQEVLKSHSAAVEGNEQIESTESAHLTVVVVGEERQGEGTGRMM